MYQYKAVSPSGEIKEGVVEGATQAGVIAHLQSTGLIPIRAAEVLAGGVATTPSTSDGGDKRRPFALSNGTAGRGGMGRSSSSACSSANSRSIDSMA